jgi:hypothetical protein
MVSMPHLHLNYSIPINFPQPFHALKFSERKYFSIHFIPLTYYLHQHFHFM